MTAASTLPDAAGRAPGPRSRVIRRGGLSWRWHPRTTAVCVALTVLIVALGVLVMATGTIQLTPAQVLAGLTGGSDDAVVRKVVTDIRLPRLLTAVFVGACLGTAGAVFQSISRNALGSPDIIGFTAGSATGAVAQIVLFNAGATATAVSAVVGGLLTALAVYALASKGGVTGGFRLVLVGIGVGSMLAAVNMLLLARAGIEQAMSAEIWLAGSLNARAWEHVWPVLIGFVVLLPVILALGRHLDLMEMGDDAARQLGVRVERTRLVLMVAAVGMTALATASAGPIAFVALAAPQLVVRVTRSVRAPLASSAFMGAALVVAADLLTQYLPVNAAIPIGRMTGLLGGAYLLWLLTRSRQV